MPRSFATSTAALTFALALAMTGALAQDGAIPYPDDYRNWFHVTSASSGAMRERAV